MEDAGALGHLFRSIHDPAAIEARLELFERVRKDRVSRIQILSKVRAGREKEVARELRQYADEPGAGTSCVAGERGVVKNAHRTRSGAVYASGADRSRL